MVKRVELLKAIKTQNNDFKNKQKTSKIQPNYKQKTSKIQAKNNRYILITNYLLLFTNY